MAAAPPEHTPTTRYSEYLRVADLPPDPRNPKGHALDELERSMERFGYIEPVVIDERTGMLLSGHGRREVLERRRLRGDAPPVGVEVDEEGWWTILVVRGVRTANDKEAGAYLIAANQLTIKGGWTDGLPDLLTELAADEDGFGLEGTGWTGLELDGLLAELEAQRNPEPDPLGDPDDRGRVLKLTSVAFGEPEHEVEHGQLWQVGQHRLIIADLMTEHARWVPHLREGWLFFPYPSLYVLLSRRADERPCLALQPDRYLAGHLLDKYASARGADTVTLLAAK